MSDVSASADGNYEVRYKSNVLIYPNGEVLWVPPAIYQVPMWCAGRIRGRGGTGERAFVSSLGATTAITIW